MRIRFLVLGALVLISTSGAQAQDAQSQAALCAIANRAFDQNLSPAQRQEAVQSVIQKEPPRFSLKYTIAQGSDGRGPGYQVYVDVHDATGKKVDTISLPSRQTRNGREIYNPLGHNDVKFFIDGLAAQGVPLEFLRIESLVPQQMHRILREGPTGQTEIQRHRQAAQRQLEFSLPALRKFTHEATVSAKLDKCVAEGWLNADVVNRRTVDEASKLGGRYVGCEWSSRHKVRLIRPQKPETTIAITDPATAAQCAEKAYCSGEVKCNLEIPNRDGTRRTISGVYTMATCNARSNTPGSFYCPRSGQECVSDRKLQVRQIELSASAVSSQAGETGANATR